MEQRIEEQYLDVLQNIEAAIQEVDRESEDLTDLEVQDALEALIQTYNAEANGRTPSPLRLTPLKRKVYDRVREVCEWRLGRDTIVTLEETRQRDLPVPLEIEPLNPSELVLCLKRIHKSVKMWSKTHGRRGYLEFVSGFIP